MEAAALSQSTGARPNPAGWPAKFFVLAPLLAGAILRVILFRQFFEASGDSLVYGDIAKNLLLHGRYALTLGSGQAFATLIRLPGYPLFLAACFSLFGIENYAAAAWFQIALDLVACLLLADFARRIAPPRLARRSAHLTLWLAALCPFTAVYAANPLTEGPTLFCISLALWSVARFRDQPRWLFALAFTLAVTSAALLRPDGALVAVALAPAMLLGIRAHQAPRAQIARIALACVFLALAPFAAWTWRNWRVFHVFQPLAPRTATDPGDPLTPGWDRWVKTWCLDFISTYTVVWNVPGDVLDVRRLPARAFDSPAQFHATTALADAYNNNRWNLTPQIDAGFAQLAAARIAADPLRYYVLLPIGRLADMWLRPRVENLPIDVDWWVYSHHHNETVFSWFYAGLNALYLLLGFAGLCLRPRLWVWMLLYIVLRSALLLTVVPPEARYTLECFPILFVCGGVFLARISKSGHSRA
ncbi:MAG TPA: glycosyltransferase family 39 protein [Terracidiphilus sp.]|nr:glycosyltransferase family 39 protein [Terracidiphilus sp.]